MKLYLARHTQTNYNLLGLANSDPTVDVHLSDEGIQQAQRLGTLLEGVVFDRVFVSELPRTRQTAQVLLGAKAKTFVVDSRLNDNATGFESQPVQKWLDAVSQSVDPWGTKFNEGESKNEAAARAKQFIEELRTKEYENVLVVTHGFLTQMISGFLEGKTLEASETFNLVQGTYATFDL